MRTTRLLTLDDVDKVVELHKLLESWRSPHQPAEKFQWFQNKDNLVNAINDESTLFPATFDDGELVAFIRQTFWKTMPHWSLGNVTTRIRTVGVDMEKNGIGECTKLALNIAESRGIYRFYTSISERQMSQALFDTWTKAVPELNEYLYVVEAEVEHGEKSIYPVIEHLLIAARLPEPYVSKYYVRSATAINKRRNFKIFKERSFK